MEQEVATPGDLFAILRRRRTQLFVPFIVLFVISLGVAFGLPAEYRSEAIILIEQQDIPQELVRSTITSYADQRIQIISQRVMTTSNLSGIIEKYNLYADSRERATKEETLERMRDDINMEMISADVIDPRSGRPTQATIAFSLAYNSKSPDLAQKVTNELVSLYLSENLRSRTQKTKETAGFLSAEADKLRQYITELEIKLAVFKQKNMSQLPELMQLNFQIMSRIEQDLSSTEQNIQTLEERKIYFVSELAQLEPQSTLYTTSGERILGSEARLKTLQAQYVSKSAIYVENHPDLVRMRKEIRALKIEVGGQGDNSELLNRMKLLKTELATSREKYSADHPDVKKLEREIASLKVELENAKQTKKIEKTASKPDNPAYIQLQAQLEVTKAEIRALKDKHKSLKLKMESYEKRLTEAPRVESEYRTMSRDYENALTRYREIKAKQMEAQLADEMEKDSKGERFSLIEPPLLPEKPSKPNRLAIIFVGFIFSLVGGIGTVAVTESLDGSIFGPKDVASIMGENPLALIPYIPNEDDATKIKHQRVVFGASTAAGFILFIIFVHFAFKPLDVLWFLVMRKLGI